MLRPFRFRIMVLTLVLLAGFALAWRLGQGVGSLGRRGLVLIGGGVLVLAISIAYSQAIRAWGSPGVVSSVSDLVDTLEARLGAVPRPIEALVGFPALVWGVATRTRRRQGWWMCAFGALGAAEVGHQDQRRAAFAQQFDRRQRRPDAGVVGDMTTYLLRFASGGVVRQGDVEVHPDEDPSALDFGVADACLVECHRRSGACRRRL